MAIVDPAAELADDVQVGPFCVVGPSVRLGSGTRLIGHVTVMGRTTLGSHNTVWPGAVLGGDPQDLKFKGEDSELIIGDHNDFRECVTVHKGTDNDQGVTRIGSHNLIMAYTHVGHDCILHDHIVIANSVQLAGHILMEDHTNIGGASAVHHFVTIGRYAFIAGDSAVTRDVPPYMVVNGHPAIVRKVNTTLLMRHRFADEQMERLKKAYRQIFGREVNDSTNALTSLKEQFPDDEHVQYLCDFISRSASGVYGRYREAQRRDHAFSNPVR